MTSNALAKVAKALPLAAVLLAYGCGGGGSGTTADGGPSTMPPGMGPDETLTLAAGVAIGDQEPLLAEGTGIDDSAFVTRETLLADPTNTFRVFSATLRRASGAIRAVGTGEHVKSIRSDGDFGFHVTYVDAGGVETTVHFTKDLVDENGGYAHTELGYWLWSQASVPFNGANYSSGSPSGFSFLGTSYFGGSYRGYAVYGPETPDSFFAENGVTAKYRGSMFARAWETDEGSLSIDNAYAIRGDVVLDYVSQGGGRGAVTGAIENMTVDRVALSPGNRVAITDGRYEGAPFSAAMSGAGDTMGGYAGGLAGAFYGPAAEGAAAVFAMERTDQGSTVHPHHVMHGFMWTAKPE